MKNTVADAMTANVVAVDGQTPFKEIVAELRRHRVSAVPVVNSELRVLGVVSAADLLFKIADPTAAEHHLLDRPGRRAELRKASGTLAAELMTSPPITITPESPLQEAAAQMRDHRISRLPVVQRDTGRLVGIISRSDLIGLFSRPDEAIRKDILDRVIPAELIMDPTRFTVTVSEGRVNIQGEIEHRSLIPMLLRVVRRVEGVVSAEANLEYGEDDTVARLSAYTGLPFR